MVKIQVYVLVNNFKMILNNSLVQFWGNVMVIKIFESEFFKVFVILILLLMVYFFYEIY